MKLFKKYVTRPTRRTPAVLLEAGRIIITGRSISENPREFYRPVYEWIREYVNADHTMTSVEFGFEYINTSSTKWIYNIIKLLSGVEDISERVKVIWYHERGDDDMNELGLILMSLVECPFDIVEVAEMKKIAGDPVFLKTL